MSEQDTAIEAKQETAPEVKQESVPEVKLNLYWPVYKNLEREVLKLADSIHFSDDQLEVYSMSIADLIVRCAVEIEAISKELYSIVIEEEKDAQKIANEAQLQAIEAQISASKAQKTANKAQIIANKAQEYANETQLAVKKLEDNTKNVHKREQKIAEMKKAQKLVEAAQDAVKIGQDIASVTQEEAKEAQEIAKAKGETLVSDGFNGYPNFDIVCLKRLNQEWHLDDKQIVVSASNFYFVNEENIVLTPLLNADQWGDRGCEWKQAYQAVKHDRNKSLKQANIKNLIHALGALFILNIYFKDEVIRSFVGDIEPDFRLGSEIFLVEHSDISGEIKKSASEEIDIALLLASKDLSKSIYVTRMTDEAFKRMYFLSLRDRMLERYGVDTSIQVNLPNGGTFVLMVSNQTGDGNNNFKEKLTASFSGNLGKRLYEFLQKNINNEANDNMIHTVTVLNKPYVMIYPSFSSIKKEKIASMDCDDDVREVFAKLLDGTLFDDSIQS